MKYLLILAFYIMAFIYHVLDIVIRTIWNFFVITWDFKWKPEKLYSYNTIHHIGDKHNAGEDVSISKHYSWKQFISDMKKPIPKPDQQ